MFIFTGYEAGMYLGSHKEDIIVDVVDSGGDDGQRHTRENVGVVSLAWIESLSIVSDWSER